MATSENSRQLEEAVVKSTVGVSAKRNKKASEKKDKRKKKLHLSNDEEDSVDHEAVNRAMQMYESRDPKKSKRGRKVTREDIYISESLA